MRSSAPHGAGTGLLLAMLMVGCTPAQPTVEPSAAAATTQAEALAEGVGNESQATTVPSALTPAYVATTPAALQGTYSVGGVETRTLELKPNGRYALKGGAVWDLVESTWALEQGGTHLRLRRDHRQSEDLLFGVESADVLVLLNADGSPTSLRSTLDRVKK
ncbi:hypothetical protein [Stenotrophomonas sp.]|uniref:hypothetical protein n=1 Tax=Stenotrophomonas sp. TaxID=69392 RepID=UPI0028A5BFD5|nr:hypothetical protein [Stenotrophomonas sp.]